MNKPKTIDEIYSEYKLFYAKRYIELARTKKELFEAVQDIPITDLCKRYDLLDSFYKKVTELRG